MDKERRISNYMSDLQFELDGLVVQRALNGDECGSDTLQQWIEDKAYTYCYENYIQIDEGIHALIKNNAEVMGFNNAIYWE